LEKWQVSQAGNADMVAQRRDWMVTRPAWLVGAGFWTVLGLAPDGVIRLYFNRENST